MSIDVVKYTSKELQPPCLIGSVLSALKLGVHLLPTGARQAAFDSLDTFVQTCKEHTFKRLTLHSWGIMADLPTPPHTGERRSDVVSPDTWRGDEIVPADEVDVLPLDKAPAGVLPAETPVADLALEREETCPFKLTHRRKLNYLLGRSRFWQSLKVRWPLTGHSRILSLQPSEEERDRTTWTRTN